jgi:hypothetical protein
MDVGEIMRGAICSLYPPRMFILAVATLGLALGGVLIAIGEKDRGLFYLIATVLGGVFAYWARDLVGLVGLSSGC